MAHVAHAKDRIRPICRFPPEGVLILFCEEGLKFGEAVRDRLNLSMIWYSCGCCGLFQGQKWLRAQDRRALRTGHSAHVVVGVGKAGDLKLEISSSSVALRWGDPRAPRRATCGGFARRTAQTGSDRRDLHLAFCCAPIGSIDTRPSARRMKTRHRSQGDDRSARGRARRKPLKVAQDAVGDGVLIARDLVNEPANVLYPEEFARRAGELEEPRCRGRGARPSGDEEARHECAARRGSGLRAREPHRHHAVEGGKANARHRVHRQGRVLRYRRHLDQARR